MVPALIGTATADRRTIPLVTAAPATQAAELGITWLGHATTLIEIDGHYVLTDPVWGERVSPSETIGPARLHPVPIAIGRPARRSTPIVISHDHYDHLDLPTVRQLLRRQTAPVPRAARHRRPPARLGRPGGPDHRAGLGRAGDDRRADADLHRVPALLRTRAAPQHHPVVLLGDRRARAPGVLRRRHRLHRRVHRHRRAVRAVRRHGAADRRVRRPMAGHPPQPGGGRRRRTGTCGGGLFVPIHWATFDLALHTWAEPVERLLAAGDGFGSPCRGRASGSTPDDRRSRRTAGGARSADPAADLPTSDPSPSQVTLQLR